MNDVKSRAELICKDPECKAMLARIRNALPQCCIWTILEHDGEVYLVADVTTCGDTGEPTKDHRHGSCAWRLHRDDGLVRIVGAVYLLANELHRLLHGQPSRANFANLYGGDFLATVVNR